MICEQTCDYRYLFLKENYPLVNYRSEHFLYAFKASITLLYVHFLSSTPLSSKIDGKTDYICMNSRYYPCQLHHAIQMLPLFCFRHRIKQTCYLFITVSLFLHWVYIDVDVTYYSGNIL